MEGGITVLLDEVPIASLSCKPGPETVIAPMFTLQDAMTDSGYCRDPERHEWRLDGCD